jgi:very-short-patch-repair endonuclease
MGRGCIRRMSTKRQPGAAKRARHLRNNATNAEQRLWQALRRRQFEGYKFRRQHSIGSYIVDFACLERWLVIEVDGGQHLELSKHDTTRDTELRTRGFRVLRFWNTDVLTSMSSVETAILQALAGDPLPHPPPHAGEGANNAALGTV